MTRALFLAALVTLAACTGSVSDTLSRFPPYQPQTLPAGSPVAGAQQ